MEAFSLMHPRPKMAIQYLSSFISKNQSCLIPAVELCVTAWLYVIKKIALQTSKLKDSQGGRAPLGQNTNNYLYTKIRSSRIT